MAAHVVIDGYNLIGRQGLSDIEAQREDLIATLAVYKRLKKVKITVVFDGLKSGRLSRGEESRSGIKVVFSRSGEEADAILKDLSRSGGQNITVVTSDNDVAHFAKRCGAVVIGSDEFIGLLDAALYEDMKGIDPGEDEDRGHEKKGPSKRPSREERKRLKRIKKL